MTETSWLCRRYDPRTECCSTRYFSDCPLKPRCCPKEAARKIRRDVNEAARDRARSLVGTPDSERSCDERKKVEMRFAHLKTDHRFERMRLRGLRNARNKFLLAAIVQNLTTMAMKLTAPAWCERQIKARSATTISAQPTLKMTKSRAGPTFSTASVKGGCVRLPRRCLVDGS